MRSLNTLPVVLYGPDPYGRLYPAASCSVSTALQSAITCSTIAGVGGRLSWYVTVAGQAADPLWNITSYVSPKVSVSSAPLLDTAGGGVLRVNGSSFGPAVLFGNKPGVITLSFGPTGTWFYAVNCLVIDDAHVTCTAPPGGGSGHKFLLIVGGQSPTAGLFGLVSYKTPTISSVYGPGHVGGDTAGGILIGLRGAQFSNGLPPNIAPIVHYGPAGNVSKYTAVNCVMIIMHQVLSCVTAPGVGMGLEWQIVVDGQASAVFSAGSQYAQPVIADYMGIGAANAETRGGQVTNLTGRNFGPVSENAIDSVISGRGLSREFFVHNATYHRCVVVIDHVRIMCLTAEGAGNGLTWSVVIAGLNSVVPATSYAIPVITSFQGAGAINANTDGGQSVIIRGMDFGPLPRIGWPIYLESVTYGALGVEYDVTKRCNAISHDVLSCQLLPGMGVVQWFVRVRGQTSLPSGAFTNYAPPFVDRLWPDGVTPNPDGMPSLGITNVPTAGGMDLKESAFVLGTNFAVLDLLSTIDILVDGVPVSRVKLASSQFNVTDASVSTYITDLRVVQSLIQNGDKTIYKEVDEIVFLYTNVKRNLVLSVTQATDPATGVISQTAKTLNTYDERLVTVAGQLTRIVAHKVTVLTQRQVHRVLFGLPSGEGANHAVTVRITGPSKQVVLSNVMLLHYGKPIINEVSATTLPCDWYWTTVTTDPVSGVLIEEQNSTRTKCIQFTINGANFGPNNNAYISIGDVSGATYQLTSADTIAYADAASAARNSIPVMFCNMSNYALVYCNFSYFDFFADRSIGGYIHIRDSSDRASNVKEFSNFYPYIPGRMVDALSKLSFNTDGSSWLGLDDNYAIEGPNIGTPGSNTYVLVDGRVCGNLTILSPTQSTAHDPDFSGESVGRIACVVPRGYRGTGTIKIVALGMPFLVTPLVLYAPPSVSCILSGNHPSGVCGVAPSVPVVLPNGSSIVTIVGSNFGSMLDVVRDCKNPALQDECTNPVTGSQCESRDACAATQRADPTAASHVVLHNAEPMGYVVLRSPEDDGTEPCPLATVAHCSEEFTEARVLWWSHHQIVVEVPAGLGARRYLKVLVGVSSESARPPKDSSNLMISYAPPVVLGVVIFNASVPYNNTSVGATAGGQRVRISGNNFGTFHPLRGQETFIHFCRVCEPVGANCFPVCRECTIRRASDLSDVETVCVSPFGTGSGWYVRVLANGLDNSATGPYSSAASWSYHIPVITGLSRRAADTSGGVNITVFGNNFGALALAVPVSVTVIGYDFDDDKIRHVPDALVYRVSDSELGFTLPQGQGALNDVILKVDFLYSEATEATRFQYNPPTILHIAEYEQWPRMNPATGCCNTDGGYKINLIGKSFGLLVSQRVFFSPALSRFRHLDLTTGLPVDWLECVVDISEAKRTSDLVWAHNKAVCTMPGGIGANLPFQMFTGNAKVGSAYQRCNSHGPCIRSLPQSSLNYTCHTDYCGSMSRPLFSFDQPHLQRMQPDPGNADGGAISLFGYNFGAGAKESALMKPEIVIGGVVCEEADFIAPAGGKPPYLACKLPKVTVGYHNMTMNVAGQIMTLSDDPHTNLVLYSALFTFEAYCLPQFYANVSEYCLACPVGAICAQCKQGKQLLPDGTEQVICTIKYVNEPYAKPGWWNLFQLTHYPDRSINPLVAPERLNRVYSPFFVPCQPQASCLGNNVCAKGYTAIRCAICATQFFRLDGVCVPCPNNAILLVVVFVAACLMLMGFGFVLNKKKMHLAFVSIGVDYFQILAMFANTGVPWPPQIVQILRLLSIFNINIEIVAPECTIPNLQYKSKWFFIMLIPLITATGFTVATLGQWINKRVIMGQRMGLWNHANAMVGSMLMAMNYLYLYLTRTTLDVFNCQSTIPPDGHQYLQVMFEECGLPGGTQVTLLPFAILSFIFYITAFPAFVASILYKNRLLVQEDQILRCHRLGDVKTQGPKTFNLRQRYHKMYYHFAPNYWYWRVMILVRKFCIAFTSLMFNKNLTFQLAMVLLVVIVSYALQVKHSPYLSSSAMTEIVRQHQLSAAAGDPVHVQIAADIAPTLADAQVKRRMSTANKWKRQETTATAVAEFFFDYNTVDAVLLFCLILVVIGGIMFISQASAESAGIDFANQGLYAAFLTVGVIGVLVLSIAYLFAVFLSEMYVTFWPEMAAARQRASKERAAAKKTANEAALAAKASKGGRLVKLTAAAAGPKTSEESLSDSVGINPMFAAKLKMQEVREEGLPDREQWERVKEAYRTLRDDLEESQQEVAEQKRRNAELEAQLNVARSGGQASGALRKKEFTPQLR